VFDEMPQPVKSLKFMQKSNVLGLLAWEHYNYIEIYGTSNIPWHAFLFFFLRGTEKKLRMLEKERSTIVPSPRHQCTAHVMHEKT
jgi:hypothetical protein